ncbi:MAG: hypothetical protein COA86_12355 [Kangiella sp.]|nr:MAG: hypothetical protein COA86_12355 [Kangiella sp.]
MKLLLTFSFIIVISLPSSIDAKNLTLSKTSSEMLFSSIDTSPEGFTFGYQGGGESYKWYLEYQALEDNQIKFEYNSFNLGTNFNFSTRENISYGLNLEVGTGSADLKTSSNEFDYFSISSGGFAEYKPTEVFSIIARLQYSFYFESTANTVCRDGTTSESTGRGTCSSHGGISFLNEKLGNADGIKFNIGVQLYF